MNKIKLYELDDVGKTSEKVAQLQKKLKTASGSEKAAIEKVIEKLTGELDNMIGHIGMGDDLDLDFDMDETFGESGIDGKLWRDSLSPIPSDSFDKMENLVDQRLLNQFYDAAAAITVELGNEGIETKEIYAYLYNRMIN